MSDGDDKIWQVRLPDGTVHIGDDARPDDPRRSWIYARNTADTLAERIGGTVVEVTKRQKEAVLDKEIAFALNEPKPTPKDKPAKLRTRPFARAAQRKIATAIRENVALNHAAYSAIGTAQEADDDATYKQALRTLKAGLPATLWVGYDPDEDYAAVNTVAPMWMSEDPAGEDPRHWMQIDRDEVARLLVEAK